MKDPRMNYPFWHSPAALSIIFSLSLFALLNIRAFLKRIKLHEKRVTVVCLAALDQSPRLQNHIRSLIDNGYTVDAITLEGK